MTNVVPLSAFCAGAERAPQQDIDFLESTLALFKANKIESFSLVYVCDSSVQTYTNSSCITQELGAIEILKMDAQLRVGVR